MERLRTTPLLKGAHYPPLKTSPTPRTTLHGQREERKRGRGWKKEKEGRKGKQAEEEAYHCFRSRGRHSSLLLKPLPPPFYARGAWSSVKNPRYYHRPRLGYFWTTPNRRPSLTIATGVYYRRHRLSFMSSLSAQKRATERFHHH